MSFPTFCLIAFFIVFIAMERDPVIKFVIANPGFILARLTFAHWYMLVTSRHVMNWHMRLLPVESIIFYSELIDTYMELFPEAAEPMEEDDI